MTPELEKTKQIPELRNLLEAEPDLLNLRPQSARRFVTDCHIFGRFPCPFSEDMIFRLWRAAILRAEFVAIEDSDERDINKKERRSMRQCIEDNQEFISADWFSIINKKASSTKHCPFFHPYRYLVLWEIIRLTKPPLHPISFPITEAGHIELSDWTNHLNGSESPFKNPEIVNRINSLAELSILCEPCSFSRVTNTVSWSIGKSQEEINLARAKYEENVHSKLQAVGLEALEEARRSLCMYAQQAEPNCRIHKLMRLCNFDTRRNLRGDLAAAVLFTEMAEVIRRTSEKAFSVCLPEEDEMGYVTRNKHARARIYGSGRPLDAPAYVTKAFLRDLGIDLGIKARVYVEGHTEFGAIQFLVGSMPHVEVVNLQGQFIEKKRPVFLENLKLEIRNQIFSFVLLDFDKDDNLKPLQIAASNGDFFGEAYIFKPDFEASFSSNSKNSAAIQWAKDNRLSSVEIDILTDHLDWAKGTNKVMSEIRENFEKMSDFAKGEKWGRHLAMSICDLPIPTEAKMLQKEKNPLLKATGRIIMSSRYDYKSSTEESEVNPETLQLVKKKAAQA